MTSLDLMQRRSVPARQLEAPGPDDATFTRMLACAVRVPDHGKRVPFRFVRIAGAARDVLGERLAGFTLDDTPGAADSAVEKDRHRFSHAPLVVAVVAAQGPDDKIPASERFSTASCVCLLLLQAAQAEGFGAQWLTGWPAYDRPFLEGTLGLSPDEQLAGTIAIGRSQVAVPERERPDPASLLTDLAL